MPAPELDPKDLAGQILGLKRELESLQRRTPTKTFTTAQRPAANTVPGMVIFNSTTGKHEGSNGATWNALY